MSDRPQMRSRLPFLGGKSCSFIRRSEGETEPPHWWGGVPNTGGPDPGSPSPFPLPTHQHIDVLLLREEGTHFLHISAKDGLDQGRLRGEPAVRERARARTEPGGGGALRLEGGVAGGARLRGSRLQRIPGASPTARPVPKDTPAPRRRARREPREPRARAQSRPHIPGLAWRRRRRALGGGSGEGREGRPGP